MCENGRRRNDVVGIFCTHTEKMKKRSKQVNFGDLAEEMTLNKSILYFSYKSFELVMIMNLIVLMCFWMAKISPNWKL